MGLYEYLSYLFAENENIRKQIEKGNKDLVTMTDAEIKRQVRIEFPNAKTFENSTVNRFRRSYNEGTLLKHVGKPKRKSQRYDASGKVVKGNTGRPE